MHLFVTPSTGIATINKLPVNLTTDHFVARCLPGRSQNSDALLYIIFWHVSKDSYSVFQSSTTPQPQ